jgi:aryl-alcohol dehydrogenase-like predicted oxidoreductase
MEYRTLGKTGLGVSEIGFGGWGIGGDWGATDERESLRALEAALDAGVTFFDTARGYGDGRSEELIGTAVAGRRDRVVIATKIPPRTGRWPVLPREPLADTFPAAWIVECTEKSLHALRTDYLDVQQLHAWTPPYLRQPEWHEALAKLKAQGKVRAFGVSANDWDPDGPVELVRSGLIDSVQVIFNIFEQRPAERLLPAALANGVGVIVRLPFEEGLLTGKLGPDHRFGEGDWRSEWLTPDRLREAARRVDGLRPLLGDEARMLPELALKFCLSHPAVSTVIPGMRSVEHVRRNCAASDRRPLSAETVQALKGHAFPHGWAYPWSQS